jgi:uncharacterized glyoxalase superfamily protein PhnB
MRSISLLMRREPMAEWKPTNYPSVSPYLICTDAEALVRFITEAFDGILLQRRDRPDGSFMHAEVRIADSVVMVGGGRTEEQSTSSHVHVYVPDAEATFKRAVIAGADIVQKPERKEYLRGGVKDPSGTTWWIAQL